jgi:hypothetical protein
MIKVKTVLIVVEFYTNLPEVGQNWMSGYESSHLHHYNRCEFQAIQLNEV